jgi:hypothetical protein
MQGRKSDKETIILDHRCLDYCNCKILAGRESGVRQLTWDIARGMICATKESYYCTGYYRALVCNCQNHMKPIRVVEGAKLYLAKKSLL